MMPSGSPSRYVTLAACLGLAALAGCGGRMANPTPEVSIYDRYMTCEEIRQEVERNYAAQSALVREQNWANEKNHMISGLSLVFPPGWFALDETIEGDYGTAPQEIEASALATRSRHIIGIAQKDQCWPDPKVWSPAS
jgi:hypothetical protein